MPKTGKLDTSNVTRTLRQFPVRYLFGNSGVIYARNIPKLGKLDTSNVTRTVRQFPIRYLFGKSGVIHAHSVSKSGKIRSSNVTRVLSSPYGIRLEILELSMRATCPSHLRHRDRRMRYSDPMRALLITFASKTIFCHLIFRLFPTYFTWKLFKLLSWPAHNVHIWLSVERTYIW